MATQLLIYERAVPVNSAQHGDWSVKTGVDYAFAKHVNTVPLTAAEFASASEEYAIIFAGDDQTVMPAVMLGVRQDENLYVDDDGAWNGKYIPAFVRRYPFVFSRTDDGTRFTLCIDEEFTGCNTDGRGERLFDAEGEQTQYLQSILGFLQAYQAQFDRTAAFCAKLKELDLLEPMQAQVTVGSGERLALTGFMAVNRDRLKALDAEQVADLLQTDELELIFIHLNSMRNFDPLAQRVAPGETPAAQANGEDAPAADEAEESAAET